MTPKRKAKKLAPNNSNQGLIVIVFVSEVSIALMLSLSAMNDIVTEALNKIFSLLAILSVALSILIVLLQLILTEKSMIKQRAFEMIHTNSILLAWSIATLSTIGSLFYSEISGFIPCTFCWYERIAMYPLVIILGIATFKKHQYAWIYASPFSLMGLVISIYHYQLQMFPDQSSVSCSTEVSCSGSWILEFGFVTMPFMALSTFLLISVLLLSPQIKK